MLNEGIDAETLSAFDSMYCFDLICIINKTFGCEENSGKCMNRVNSIKHLIKPKNSESAVKGTLGRLMNGNQKGIIYFARE